MSYSFYLLNIPVLTIELLKYYSYNKLHYYNFKKYQYFFLLQIILNFFFKSCAHTTILNNSILKSFLWQTWLCALVFLSFLVCFPAGIISFNLLKLGSATHLDNSFTWQKIMLEVSPRLWKMFFSWVSLKSRMNYKQELPNSIPS